MRKIIAFFVVLTLLNKQSFSQHKEIPFSTTQNIIAVYQDPDIPPSFPGGERAWLQFLQEKLQVNIASDNKAPAGTYRVVINFVVDTTGQAVNLIPQTSYGYGLEEEAIRVLKLSSWKPATLKGKHVNAPKSVPVTFVVEPTAVKI